VAQSRTRKRGSKKNVSDKNRLNLRGEVTERKSGLRSEDSIERNKNMWKDEKSDKGQRGQTITKQNGKKKKKKLPVYYLSKAFAEGREHTELTCETGMEAMIKKKPSGR